MNVGRRRRQGISAPRANGMAHRNREKGEAR